MKAIRTHQLKDEKGVPLTVLPWNKRVDGTPYSGLRWERPQSKKPRTKGKSLCGSCHAHDLMILERYGDERQPHTTSAMLHCHNTCLPINILFDTGALQGNYLSKDVAGWMRKHGAVAEADSRQVCGAFNKCQLTKNLFLCKLSLVA